MIKINKVIIYMFFCLISLVSCFSQTSTNKSTDGYKLTKEVSLEPPPPLYDFSDIQLTIKKNETIVENSIDIGDRDKNKDLLSKITKDYKLAKLVVYKKYQDSKDDLVVAYGENYKIILAKYNPEKLSLNYLTMPDKETLEYVYNMKTLIMKIVKMSRKNL